MTALPINTMLPHRLAFGCVDRRARLIHVSTDCVFSGRRACIWKVTYPIQEFVWQVKFIGELHDVPHAVIYELRCGHETE